MKRRSSLQVACLLTSLLILSSCGANLNTHLGGADHYALPLRLSQQIGCGAGQSLIYQIDVQGNFQFLASETAAKPTFVTRQLSEADRAELAQVLETADLAAQTATALPVVPDPNTGVNPGSPITAPPLGLVPKVAATATPQPGATPPDVAPSQPLSGGCQPVDQLSLQHDGREAVYAHALNVGDTNRYNTAWNAVRRELDALRDRYAPAAVPGNRPVASYAYDLPLQLDVEGECGLPSYTRYALSADGKLRYTPEAVPDAAGASQPQAVSERLLSGDERSALLAALAELDLARQAVADTPVPADAPTTLECRSVRLLRLAVNGEARSFDRNGRKLAHSQAYQAAFDQLETRLQSLATALRPSYAQTLKIELVGECGLPTFTRFSVTQDGLFTWTREDYPTFAAGHPPTANRQLSPDESAALVAKLIALDLVRLAAGSEPIPADAPQTKECRTATAYHLTLDGQVSTIEGQGTRHFHHSQELLDKLAELQKYLYSLSGQQAPAGF